VYQRSGVYQLPMPLSLGMEAAGVVEAVGEGVTHQAGDRPRMRAPPGAYTRRARDAREVVVSCRRDLFETGAAMMAQGPDSAIPGAKTLPQKA